MKYIAFILFTVLTNAAAQLMLKQGMVTMGPLTFTLDTAIPRIFQIVFNPWIFAGIVLFVASLASHLFVLSKVELSFAYPFLSLAYVVVVIFGYFIFAEDLNAWRLFGIGFICVGTVLVARSGRGPEAVEPAQTAQLQVIHQTAGE